MLPRREPLTPPHLVDVGARRAEEEEEEGCGLEVRDVCDKCSLSENFGSISEATSDIEGVNRKGWHEESQNRACAIACGQTLQEL